MTLQEILTPKLGQALRPNIWDAVALILVIGALVLIVYGGEQTVLPLSALDVRAFPGKIESGGIFMLARI